METIADYSILENIDETKHSLVYRGQRPDDNKTVIIKVLKSDNPTSSEIAKLRQEYEIIRSIDIEGAIEGPGKTDSIMKKPWPVNWQPSSTWKMTGSELPGFICRVPGIRIKAGERQSKPGIWKKNTRNY